MLLALCSLERPSLPAPPAQVSASAQGGTKVWAAREEKLRQHPGLDLKARQHVLITMRGVLGNTGKVGGQISGSTGHREKLRQLLLRAP